MVGMSELPLEILDLVLQRLSLPDCLTFNKVCTRWRSAFVDRRRITRPPPCMFLRFQTHMNFSELPLWSLHGGELLKLRSPKPEFVISGRVAKSCMGWLVLGSQWSSGLQLLNPITNQHFILPKMTYCGLQIRYKPYVENRIVSVYLVELSAPPTSDDCIIMACGYQKGEGPLLTFWRQGDEQWTVLPLPFYITHTVLHKGELYMMDSNKNILVYTINPIPQPKLNTGPMASIYTNVRGPSQLVTSGEELLLVAWQNITITGSRPFRVEVFKVPMNANEGLVKVGNLGDRALLVGIRSSEFYCTKDFMGSGFEPNCIYYYDKRSKNLVKFSLEDSSSQSTPLPPHDPRTMYGIGWFAASSW